MKDYKFECGFCKAEIEATDEINEAIKDGNEDVELECSNCNCSNNIVIEYNDRDEAVNVFNADL